MTNMRSSICTLFEGDYHYGVGALVNSLCRHDFRGVVWAGYRGDLPPWASPVKRFQEFTEFQVLEQCNIRFVPLNTHIHFTNRKPHFMLQLLENFCPETEALFYFDPDIVINCRWSFYEEWVQHGIALCQDITNGDMPDNHPIRMHWKRFANSNSLFINRELKQYFNAGFVGLMKQHKSFLETWRDLLDVLEESGENLVDFMPGDRSQPFYVPDQDLMNLVAMTTTHPITTIGPEGMGLIPGGFTMTHAIGSPKPWRRKIILDALKGKKAGVADKQFWKNTRSPIPLYSEIKMLRTKTSLYFGSALGRFIRA